jgi:hypothetical protein
MFGFQRDDPDDKLDGDALFDFRRAETRSTAPGVFAEDEPLENAGLAADAPMLRALRRHGRTALCDYGVLDPNDSDRERVQRCLGLWEAPASPGEEGA